MASQPERSAEPLLVLSLAIEQAIAGENWSEVEQLLSAREAHLSAIEEGAGQISRTDLEKIRLIDNRILKGLRASRARLSGALLDLGRSNAAGRTYRIHQALVQKA